MGASGVTDAVAAESESPAGEIGLISIFPQNLISPSLVPEIRRSINMSYVLFFIILHSCFDRKSVACFLQQWTVVALDLLNYHEGDERENSELLLRMIIHG